MYARRRGYRLEKKKRSGYPGPLSLLPLALPLRRGLRLVRWRRGGAGRGVRAASRDGGAVHDLAVAGERLRDALRRLLLLARRHGAGKLDGVVRHVHHDVRTREGGLSLD